MENNEKLGQDAAFPMIQAFYDGNKRYIVDEYHNGISKRLYIATKAMQALITKDSLSKSWDHYKIIARHAFCCADELLKQENDGK